MDGFISHKIMHFSISWIFKMKNFNNVHRWGIQKCTLLLDMNKLYYEIFILDHLAQYVQWINLWG